MIIRGVFLVLALWTVPSASLVCYTCSCPAIDPSACNCIATTTVEQGAHCTITEYFNSMNSSVELSSTFFNSSYNRIKDPYYIIVDESIYLNETSNTWETKTKRVVYGCDWDYCNNFAFISSLPDTFQLSIDPAWLNENIYGNGSVAGCHNCSDGICGNETSPLVLDLCQYALCDTPARCSLRDLWFDAETNESCYQSECTSPQSSDESNENYKVQVEAIVYLAQNRTNAEVWEIDINCAVENCSRSTIFQEIRDQITTTVGNLTSFPSIRPTTTVAPPTTTSTLPINPLYCYNCSCTGASCPCTTVEIDSADNSYCSIIRIRAGQQLHTDYGHIFINSTYYYVRDYPYIIIEESITYNGVSGQWDTRPERVIYGCNWDFCNKPDLLPYLSSSFVMRLSESWLNPNILGTGQPVRNCHECSNDTVCTDTGFIDEDLCPVELCNTTCLLIDRFDDPAHTLQCYSSYCAPEDSDISSIYTPRVVIDGILYASSPDRVEVWEIDIYCRADDCSRSGIFQEIRDNLTVYTSDLNLIFNQTDEMPKIRCFDCYCSNDEDCTCDTVSVFDADSNYCTIARRSNGSNVNIYFSNNVIDGSYANIRNYPFVLAQESILYDEGTGQWYTQTDEIFYGCNWDYCNRLSLLSLLPSSLQMTLSDTWLNATILGTGASVHNCRECADNLICSSNGTVDDSSCPIASCNTTCIVHSTNVNISVNEQCYQSYCAPEDSIESSSDNHRLELRGVVYASQPDTVELWEVHAYCRGDDCTDPEIFQEISQNLIVQTENLTELFNQTNIDEQDQLSCYDCACVDDPICTCDKIVTLPAGETYCTIIRLYDGQHVYIYLEHINRNSSAVYIRNFPFMLVEESILYDESTGQWNTRPTLVVFGCNTDYCNEPNLVTRLPISFEMRLPETWLNSSILGTGQPARDCHQCPNQTYCGTTDFLDASRCPVQSCNTTCFVADIFDDPEAGTLCYQSYCLPEDSDADELSGHRVEIEGIIYGHLPTATLELWGIEIYCRADDCSRPNIFQELQARLEVNIGDLSAFFNTTIVITTPTTPTISTTLTTPTTTVVPEEPPIICYDCYCSDIPNCSCNTYTPANASSSYCTIIRQNYNPGFFIALEHIRRNSTRLFVREFPYLLVEESIIYNETTGEWYTRTDLVMYGCNTSYCNDPSLVPYLPDTFQMTLPDEWLNSNVLGSGLPVSACHQCPDAPVCSTTDFIDPNQCPISSCNTTCVVSDVYDIPNDNEECYQSICAPPDSPLFTIDPHRVHMEGILYLYPKGRAVELWEVEVSCRADNCSRPTIFDEIRDQFTTVVGNIDPFYNITITTPTTTTSTSAATTSTTTMTPSSVTGSTSSSTSSTSQAITTTTTTPTAGASIYISDIILVFSACLLNLY